MPEYGHVFLKYKYYNMYVELHYSEIWESLEYSNTVNRVCIYCFRKWHIWDIPEIWLNTLKISKTQHLNAQTFYSATKIKRPTFGANWYKVGHWKRLFSKDNVAFCFAMLHFLTMQHFVVHSYQGRCNIFHISFLSSWFSVFLF